MEFAFAYDEQAGSLNVIRSTIVEMYIGFEIQSVI